jgi:hypothetical protein
MDETQVLLSASFAPPLCGMQVSCHAYLPIPICILSSGALPTPPPSNGGAAPPAGGVSAAGRAVPFKGARVRLPAAWTEAAQADWRLAETNRNRRRLTTKARAADKPPPTNDRRADQHTSRAFTDARPPHRPHHLLRQSPDQRPALRAASTVHPPLRLIAHPGPLQPCSDAAAPPRPSRIPPGLTHQVYLDGRGRGASAARWPPFLESPRR